MPTTDTRIDAYIAKSAPFAQPVLQHLRQLVHKGCPGAEETIKWGFPHFMYNGEILCSMAAFKQHCAFGFWKVSLMNNKKEFRGNQQEAMGHLGRITGMQNLPSNKILLTWIKEAAKLNADGIKRPPRPKPKDKNELVVPDYIKNTIAKNKKAAQTFNAFSYSHKKEYVQWITEAKTEATRNKRLLQTIEWLSEGKPRHWKYKDC